MEDMSDEGMRYSTSRIRSDIWEPLATPINPTPPPLYVPRDKTRLSEVTRNVFRHWFQKCFHGFVFWSPGDKSGKSIRAINQEDKGMMWKLGVAEPLGIIKTKLHATWLPHCRTIACAFFPALISLIFQKPFKKKERYAPIKPVTRTWHSQFFSSLFLKNKVGRICPGNRSDTIYFNVPAIFFNSNPTNSLGENDIFQNETVLLMYKTVIYPRNIVSGPILNWNISWCDCFVGKTPLFEVGIYRVFPFLTTRKT